MKNFDISYKNTTAGLYYKFLTIPTYKGQSIYGNTINIQVSMMGIWSGKPYVKAVFGLEVWSSTNFYIYPVDVTNYTSSEPIVGVVRHDDEDLNTYIDFYFKSKNGEAYYFDIKGGYPCIEICASEGVTLDMLQEIGTVKKPLFTFPSRRGADLTTTITDKDSLCLSFTSTQNNSAAFVSIFNSSVNYQFCILSLPSSTTPIFGNFTLTGDADPMTYPIYTTKEDGITNVYMKFVANRRTLINAQCTDGYIWLNKYNISDLNPEDIVKTIYPNKIIGTTTKRPNYPKKGEIFIDTSFSNSKPIWWNDNIWIDSRGFTAAATVGQSNKRPIGIHTEGDTTVGILNAGNDIGFEYFDTTLGKPIYAKAIDNTTGVVTWVDATGATV